MKYNRNFAHSKYWIFPLNQDVPRCRILLLEFVYSQCKVGIPRGFLGVVFKAKVMPRPILAPKEKRGAVNENKKVRAGKSNRYTDMQLCKL